MWAALVGHVIGSLTWSITHGAMDMQVCCMGNGKTELRGLVGVWLEARCCRVVLSHVARSSHTVLRLTARNRWVIVRARYDRHLVLS